MTSYRTLAEPAQYELPPVQRSRFLANACRIVHAGEAPARVAAVAEAYPDASHHCWAYRLPPAGDVYRVHDDGEPRGSAGAPILKRIEGLELAGVLVVVTRWFGGTKLGVGGLMRAYGTAAAAVLDHAPIIEVVPMCRLTVTLPYAAEGRVKALLAARDMSSVHAEYGADITMHFEVPRDDADHFVEALGDATAGAARVRIE